jgi:predicted Zn-dependent peptidase
MEINLSKKWSFWVVLLVLFVVSFPQRAYSIKSSTYLEDRVEEFRLPNGMRWLFLKNGEAPVFAGIVMFRAGSMEEEVGKTGIAHLLEHMAFKGTKDISPDEIWNAFTSNGGNDLNAYTGKDETAYHIMLPSNKMELWIYLTSEMVKHSVMRDFVKEKQVVLEELVGKAENSPSGKMFIALTETAYDKSPYKWRTIGRKEDVEKLEAKDLEEFKKKYYTPDRMVGAMVGNFDISTAKNLVAKYFGDIESAKKVVEKVSKDDPQNGERRVSVQFDASPQMYIAYHKPTLPTHDDYIFDVITYLLCGGDSSRLKKRLVYEDKIARSVGCDSSVPGARLDNLFLIVTEPIGGTSYKKVENVIYEELDKLKTTKLKDSELEMAKNNVAKDFIFGMSYNEGIAHTLVYFEAMIDNWRYATRHAGVIDKINADDIMEVAKKYFTEQNRTVVQLVK